MTKIIKKQQIEDYILKCIKRIEDSLSHLKNHISDYSERDFIILFNRYNGQIDILYKVITAWDNEYDQ